MRVVTGFVAASLASAALVCSRPVLAVDTLTTGDPANSFVITDYVAGLDTPTSFAFLPDGRMVITDKGGNVILRAADGTTQTIGTFPVSAASEQGLLHVLVHPKFATNRLLIFYYSAGPSALIPGTNDDRQRVVTVPLDASSKLDMANEKTLVSGLRGPANHDGGALAIGPDGKLYIGVGDTGCNSNKPPEPVYDPTNYTATCLTLGNGKILRVNLDDGKAPADNPLVGKTVTACGASCGVNPLNPPLTGPAREDIWAWGFRNPWRFWFDGKTGNLWVGDVGEITYEEVDVIPKTGGGKHYGWPWREGGKGHPVSACQDITPKGDCVDPQYYCKHGAAAPPIDGNCASVTGGLIVDSCQFPAAFRGLYFFADNAAKWVATLQPTADRNGIVAGSRKMFATSSGQPVHVDVGPDGSIYYAVIVGAGTSKIEKIAPKTPAVCPTLPEAGADSGASTDGAVSPNGGASSGTGGSGSPGGGASSGTGATSSTGSGGRSASAGGTSGSSTTKPDASLDSGKSGSGTGKSGDDSGCGCRVASEKRGAAPALLALGAIALLGRRRRGAGEPKARRLR